MTPVVHVVHTPITSSHQWVKRYIDKDCLNISFNIDEAENIVERLLNQYYQYLNLTKIEAVKKVKRIIFRFISKNLRFKC